MQEMEKYGMQAYFLGDKKLIDALEYYVIHEDFNDYFNKKSKNFLKKPSVYFGDARSDMVVAEEFGLNFIFVAGVSEWKEGRSTCRQENLPAIEDFKEFID